MTKSIHPRHFLSFPGVLIVSVVVAAGCGGGGGPSGPEGDVDLLFEETFSGVVEGSLPVGWTIIKQQAATQEGPADWKVKSGRLNQASNIHAPHTPGLSWALNYEGTLAVVGDTSWVNISFRAHLIPRDDDGIGLIFRWRPSGVDPDGNFYRLLMVDDSASDGPKLRLDKRVDGVWTILDEKTNTYSGYEKNRRYSIEVDMVVDDFTIKLDGAIVFEFEDKLVDGGLPGGKVGFFCYAEEGADFDNVRVYRRGP